MTNYIELHCHSEFSLLDGASTIDDLLARAVALNMPALALTDHDALYGAVPFITSAKSCGIHPILGTELTLESGHHLTLLVENEAGWENLCSLITVARLNAPKGKARLPKDALRNHTDGLICLSGCRKGEIPQALKRKDNHTAQSLAHEYINLFGRNGFCIEIEHHLLPDDNRLTRSLIDLAAHVGIEAVVTNNVHYDVAEKQRLQDVLVSIQHNRPLDDALFLHRPNAEYYLKSGNDLSPLFSTYPQGLVNTLKIGERCNYVPTFGVQDLPPYPAPNGVSSNEYLAWLCDTSVTMKYGDITDHIRRQLAYELSVIDQCQLANYFLIVWDIVQFARKNHIRCQGRGSAANSLVAYLLNISPVDPLKYDLVFERFLSTERAVTPDIDIDFDAARREEVIQYIYDRYGRDHAAMACTFVTFRRRSSLRDIGRMLGLPKDALDYAVSVSDLFDSTSFTVENLSPHTVNLLLELSQQIRRFPRHLGIHNGGFVISNGFAPSKSCFVISDKPLSRRLPVEVATMPGRTVVQWDKEGLEDAGIVKIDILGLRMLSAISDAVRLVKEHTGTQIDLDGLTFDDPCIYDMISAGDTVGIFQVESRAQAQMLPRMKPRNFADIIVAISLIRPGPIQGDMVHPYLRRRLGQEKVTYYHPRLEHTLKDTLGVILFQEDVLKVARDLAGFTPGQGEQLRRALGSKDAVDAIATFHDAFVVGARQNGVAEETAELVFDKLCAFGGYSFPKSHAASFAVIVYQSAWLKRYYPAAFLAAILNNQPMGFWSPAIIVNDARRHKIPLNSININQSDATCTLEGNGIRIGLNYVNGFGGETCKKVVAARGNSPFRSLQDFLFRTRLSKRLIENLVLAGGFDWLGKSRRDLVWELGGLSSDPNALPFLTIDEPVNLPQMSRTQVLQTEFRLTGIGLHEHPLERYRPYLKRQGTHDSKSVTKTAPKTLVTVSGLNVVHQSPPTAKGFHFITLEDEFGFINVIVRPRVYAKFRRVIRNAPILVVSGQIEREGAVTNILAQSVGEFMGDGKAPQ